MGECTENLRDNFNCKALAEGTVLIDYLFKSFACSEFEHDEWRIAVNSNIEQSYDIGVTQRHDGLCFGLKTPHIIGLASVLIV